MKQVLLTLGLFALALECSGNGQVASNPAAEGSETTTANAAIRDLASALQSELKAAMQSGGPVAAIGICNTEASAITQRVASDHGMHVSRVSLKNRNPDNRPNEWQNLVLEDFEKQKAAGKDISGLTWSETVFVNEQQEFRLMKAIPTGGVCLACHGTNLSPEVSQTLAILYPEDRATGFAEGDIRGAFVVTRTVKK